MAVKANVFATVEIDWIVEARLEELFEAVKRIERAGRAGNCQAVLY